MLYDKDNIFAKIIKGNVKTDKIYEDDSVLAFFDANPIAPIHVLVIPKGEYINYLDFINKASEKDLIYFFKKVGEIASQYENFKLITNCGIKSGQSVPHFHVHIISGISNLRL